jgi:hypothetical protein
MRALAVAVLTPITWGVSANEIATATAGVAPSVSQTVNEMIVLDAERALKAEKKMLADAEARLDGQSGGSQVPLVDAISGVTSQNPEEPPQPTVAPVAMEVLGIFGLGHSLMADVAINGSRVRFKRGQLYPAGVAPGYPFKLVSIKTPCVKVVDSAKAEHEACLVKKF